MTEVQSRAAPKRNRVRVNGIVSASALAVHFACTRENIARLEREGIIDRLADGYDRDASRLKYIRHLRKPRSARTEADAGHIAAKTAMLEIKIAQQRRELVRREDCDALIDQIAGVMLTGLSGLAARVSRDPAVRQNVEVAVRQIRIELAQTCELLGDRAGEPPLADQQRQAQEATA